MADVLFKIKGTHYPENVFQYIHYYYKSFYDYEDWLHQHGIYDEMMDICVNGKLMTEEQVARFEERLDEIVTNKRDLTIIHERFQNMNEINTIAKHHYLCEKSVYHVFTRNLAKRFAMKNDSIKYVLFGNCEQPSEAYLLSCSIFEIDFGHHSRVDLLHRNGFNTIADLVDCIQNNPKRFEMIDGFGKRSMASMTKKLKSLGLLE
jgi:hypothetical protein